MPDPFVSIVIPCRNEERYIGPCLDSILANDYPKDRLEIFVVDGMSEDDTRKRVQEYLLRYPYITLLENPQRIIPTALNLGIRKARGDIIMKIDAHTVYGADYISQCVKYLRDYDADNVGGLIITIPRNDTLIGRAIVRVLSHKFGVGNAYHRLLPKEPMWADTAFSGCYRRDVFDRIGMYDERIARSEDVALNSRLRRHGGRILLVPCIIAHYYARSRFGEFIKHNFDNGYWITYPLRFGCVLFSWRHLVPLVFVLGLLMTALLGAWSPFFWLLGGIIGGIYLLGNLAASAQIAWRERNFRYLGVVPFIFGLLHIGYGLGSIWGGLRVVGHSDFWKRLLRNKNQYPTTIRPT